MFPCQHFIGETCLKRMDNPMDWCPECQWAFEFQSEQRRERIRAGF